MKDMMLKKLREYIISHAKKKRWPIINKQAFIGKIEQNKSG